MNKCIFCQIINREQNADIVYEDKDFIVFKDIHPKTKVHLLIVTKQHIKSLNDLNNVNLAGRLLMLAKYVAKEQKIGKAYNLLCNTGKQAGQIINHLHFHLMGGGVI